MLPKFENESDKFGSSIAVELLPIVDTVNILFINKVGSYGSGALGR
jgi:hypothetical protein